MSSSPQQLLLAVGRSPDVPVADKSERKRAAEAARAERVELERAVEAHQRGAEADKATVAVLEAQAARKAEELKRVEEELKDLGAQIGALQKEVSLEAQAAEAPVSLAMVIFLLGFSLLLVAAIWMLTLGDAPLPHSAPLRWLFGARRNPGMRPPS